MGWGDRLCRIFIVELRGGVDYLRITYMYKYRWNIGRWCARSGFGESGFIARGYNYSLLIQLKCTLHRLELHDYDMSSLSFVYTANTMLIQYYLGHQIRLDISKSQEIRRQQSRTKQDRRRNSHNPPSTARLLDRPSRNDAALPGLRHSQTAQLGSRVSLPAVLPSTDGDGRKRGQNNSRR